MRKHALRHVGTLRAFVAVLLAITLVAGCDGSSADGPSTSAPTSVATSTSTPVGQGDVHAALRVANWGYTSDGLLSVMVRNDGPGVVRYARALILAKDSDDDLVASLTAPPNTFLGTRCCTIVGLKPGQSYGLYAKIALGGAKRIDHVQMQYSNVKVGTTPNLPRPLDYLQHPELTISKDRAHVDVDVKIADKAGPYFTIQAQLHDSDGKFLGVISSGFFCIAPGLKRTVGLEFFHPLPDGAMVNSVAAFPLDAKTAQLEKLKGCN